MAYNYTYIDGQRVEVNVAAAFKLLAAAFKNKFNLNLLVTSGTRTTAEQRYLYLQWVNRVPGFNLAAAPGNSNHEENGPIGPRALDLRDSGKDRGVTYSGTIRANWLKANAPKYGFVPAGYNPSWSQIEPWHYEYSGKIGGTASSSAGTGGTIASFVNIKVGEFRADGYPFGYYRLAKGDTEEYVCRIFGMSKNRFRTINNKLSGWGNGNWPVSLVVKVAWDYADLKFKYLDKWNKNYLQTAQVQHHLQTVYPLYAKNLAVDSEYGNGTFNCVAEFQRRTPGLGASGKVDQKTWDKMYPKAVVKPSDAVYHTIKSGDTLWDLSAKNSTSVEALEKLNPNAVPNALQIGDKIRIK